MMFHLPAGTESNRSREVTLLPRHWNWLAAQPRSASATLRLLVEEARRDKDGRHQLRESQETCYAFLRDNAGDRPHFETAIRALFASDASAFADAVAPWPTEVRRQADTLASAVWQAGAARSG